MSVDKRNSHLGAYISSVLVVVGASVAQPPASDQHSMRVVYNISGLCPYFQAQNSYNPCNFLIGVSFIIHESSSIILEFMLMRCLFVTGGLWSERPSYD